MLGLTGKSEGVGGLVSGETRQSALRALRDCTVIRVTRGRVPAGYIELQREGLLSARQAADHPDKVDCRLKPKEDRG